MSKSRVFIGICVSFVFGIFAASVIDFSKIWIYAVMAVCLSVFALAFVVSQRLFLFLALFLFAAACGVLRLRNSIHPNEFAPQFNQQASLEGVVAEDPDLRTDKQLLTVRPKGFSQNVLVTTTLAKDFFYGDRVVIKGKLTQARAFDDFDYQKYLERFNVYAVMGYPEVLILKSHTANWFKEQILRFKHWFTERIFLVIPKPQSSLMAGILLGARRGLPQKITDNFNATGISHIVAISGYNITIIVILINSLAKFLGRRLSFYLGVSVLLGFIILTGGSASVIRAGVMGFLLLFASIIGRQYRILPALFLAAFIMLALNPRILFWDIGFQLSFMATLGIVLLMPLLETITSKMPSWFGAKELLLTTLSAIAATLPLTLFNFERLSLVAPLVNLLVLPLVPPSMLFGSLSVLPFFGAGFALPSAWILSWMLIVSEFFAKMRYSSLSISISNFTFCLLVLGQITLYLFLRGWAENKTKKDREPPVSRALSYVDNRPID